MSLDILCNSIKRLNMWAIEEEYSDYPRSAALQKLRPLN